MSFLGLKKSRSPTNSQAQHYHQQHASEYGDSPSSSQTPSIKSTSTFRKRLSSFNVFHSKRMRGHKKHGGVGYTTSHKPSYPTSRSPSPEPSLEIRRPSGLGRRASISDQLHAEAPSCPCRPTPERKWSISTPELLLTLPDGLACWSEEVNRTLERHVPSCPIARLSATLIETIFTFVPRSDLLSVAYTCKTFLEAVRPRLYRQVDLLRVEDYACATRCINLLASRRDLAAMVESFSCKLLPPLNSAGGMSPLPSVTFAIALNNMHRLTALTLPCFDSALLFHTTFRLHHLTFLTESASQSELEGIFAWLANQPRLTSLSFPRLVLDSDSIHWLAGAGSHLVGISEEDQGRNVSLAGISSSTFPFLDHVSGPASLVIALVPGRPLRSVTVHIYTAIYDGLRPSALAAELARGTADITSLGIVVPPRSRVDARTLERVLMATGAEIGATIKTLEVDCPLDEQVRFLCMPLL
jgi:hypothetical protein